MPTTHRTLLFSPLLLLITGEGLFAQTQPFEILNSREGLQQSQVMSIVQDYKGYIWIGTIRGLARDNRIPQRNLAMRFFLPPSFFSV